MRREPGLSDVSQREPPCPNSDMAATKNADQDAATQAAVADELAWTPQLEGADITVCVSRGVVTLRGEVPSLSEDLAARKASLRVKGVLAVADELTVAHRPGDASDEEIAAALHRAIDWATQLPAGSVQAQVRGGAVVLTGEVPWDYQRRAVQRVVERTRGVRSVESRITLVRAVSAPDAAERIAKALVRNAEIDANSIRVRVEGNEAVLTGSVRSWSERQAAEKAAWSGRGVMSVRNEISVYG